MRKKFSKKWLTVFSFLFTAIVIALACGNWDIMYIHSNFAPEVIPNKGYTPFFYEPNEPFYGIGHDREHTTRFNDDVVNDWYSFVKGKISKEDIALLLLSDETNDELNALNNYVVEGKTNASVKKRSGSIDLNDTHVRAFIEFAYIAKQLDLLIVPIGDWDYYQSARTNGKGIPKTLLDTFAEKYEKTSDPFLKNRYWFQCLKALFYANQHDAFERFFNKTKQNVERNILYYRALGYLAAFYYEKKDFNTANRLYAEIFDKVPTMRTVTVYSFHVQSENEWQQTLKNAANTDEKVALWTLLGYYADEERAINEIYKLNPKSTHLNLLLTRLVNKKEEVLLSKVEDDNGKVDMSFVNPVLRIAEEEKTLNPYLWYLAAGYVSMWKAEYDAAEKYYAKAERLLPSTQPLVVEQLKLLRLLNSVSSIQSIKGNNVEKLTDELRWLFLSEKQEKIRSYYATEKCQEYLSTIYAKNNNPLYAELLKHNDDFYLQNRNLDVMLSFLLKTDKTPFEQLLQDIYPISADDIYHYKAIIATFNDDLDAAISNMQKAGKLAHTELYGNPFNGFIKDCHECDHQRKQTVKYTLLGMLMKMREMKQAAEQNNDVYNNSLLIGNAYYNITFYGNARLFWLSTLTTGGTIPSNEENIAIFAKKMFTDCSMAKKYYLKAAAATQNDEEKAKIAYLLAKCQRNDFYSQYYSEDKTPIEASRAFFFAWDGFKELKSKYAHTRYYKDVINECGYFDYFVRRSR